ncbi:transposase [Paeniglutamicibacter antarcticus]|uniref:Transposase IS204/IS1001/IS1096/IS1165 DDE domain-containing protein n=2 Tax=Paeniglutamicibacter antarcticus TaxID=494023 RepID=A0ABP9TR95_9MICC
MDLGAAFIKSVKANAPKAAICIDPFHCVQLASNALETVRRAFWQKTRELPDKSFAKRYKGNPWALLKNPRKLNDAQHATLKRMRADKGELWEAYLLKESLREVFAGDLDHEDVMGMISHWCDAATASALAPFMEAAATIRGHMEGIYQAVTRMASMRA